MCAHKASAHEIGDDDVIDVADVRKSYEEEDFHEMTSDYCHSCHINFSLGRP